MRRCATRDELSPFVATLGAQVDNVIGRLMNTFQIFCREAEIPLPQLTFPGHAARRDSTTGTLLVPTSVSNGFTQNTE